jgi:class 3 adenylate cyclase/tetratricopeptide (TPR) repeat protein
MECPNCGFHGLPGMSFCGMCGTRLATVCPACAFANPPDYQFCGACGQRLGEATMQRRPGAARVVAPTGLSLSTVASAESTQPFGQATVQMGGRAIESRVEEVQLQGERRTATVILADVQGSTDLMERMGSEAWVSMMNHIFHLLESEIYRYGGIVDQFRGDGLVAFFGTRAAHEDDPERAVLAALAMQAAVAGYAGELNRERGIELQLRVGVNTGEVIVASIGDQARHSEDTAMGAAIALAARMEQAAQPGTVLVSENTYRQVESQFDWEPLGEIEVKGIHRPVHVYRPLKPRPVALRSLRLETLGLSPVLIGRERELAVILDRVRELREGRGRIVFLKGDEGTGKTYLVSEVRQQVLRDNALLLQAEVPAQISARVTWLRGRCRSYEQSWPYSMWIDLLERWLGVHDASRQEAATRLREECNNLWTTATSQHYAYLATLLSLPLEVETAQQVAELDAEYLRQRTFSAVRAWVEAMAAAGPLVLSFDDIYWADGTSLQLLEYCLTLCDRLAVLFMIAFRARLRSAVWAFQQRVEQQYPHRLTELELDRLSAAESAAMIDALVGSAALPTGVKERIVAKAEGNPYYIEEIIRSLIREGKLIQEDERGGWHLARDIDELDLPDTLRGLLSAQIDDLSAAERHVLQVAALIGNVFWRNVLEELVGTEVDLGASLTGLQRAQLVHERGQVSDLGMEYGFRSALLREVAAESLLIRQRAAYAQRAADYMAQLFGEEVLTRYYDVVAHLYRTAGDPRRELFYTLSAAEYAQGIYANDEALALYRRALELVDQLTTGGEDESAGLWRDWRMESLSGAGRILLGTGQAEQAEPYLRQAVELAERSEVSSREQARLYYWLCEALFWNGRYEEQVEMAERGLALVEADGPSVEVALMNQEIAVGSLPLGKPDTYRQFTERTAQFLESLPYAEELRPAYDHVASMYAWHRREPGEAMRWLLALRERAERHHDLRALAQSHDYAGLVLMMTGDLHQAAEEHRKALGLCERVGDLLQQLDAMGHLIDALLAMGALEPAREWTERLLETASQVDNPESLAWASWRAGRVAHASGAWDEAQQWFRKAATMFEPANAPAQSAMMMYHIAAAQLHKGEQSAAVRTFAEAADLAGPETLAQNPLSLALVLTAIEAASGRTDAFETFCREWQEKLPRGTLGQWSLQPAGNRATDWSGIEGEGLDIRPEGPWTWVDPLGGSTYHADGDLIVQAANGRGLWDSNLSAPRLLRLVDGDCAWQAVCAAETKGYPAIGGLVLWHSGKDFMNVTWGFGGPGGVVFRGYVRNEQLVVGRGWLADAEEQIHLRMERRAGRVRALCSPDGEQWYQVGEAGWDVDGPVQIGLHAIGDMDRLVYPGSFAEGTAIAFRDVRVWGTGTARGGALGD